MKTLLKKISALFGFLTVCLFISAQENLNVETIFCNYGKQKGSILIELGKDVLGEHTKIKRYKSLTVFSNQTIVDSVMNTIQNDLKYSEILMESRKNGKIEIGYYCLRKENKGSDFEYILFSNKAGKMTLIYLRGNFLSGRLENELEKLKNLFIKIHHK
jgi:hypothetical protein